MASGEGGEEAADASLQIGAAGSDASTDKPKSNLLARAAHKVSKRTRAAAEKLKGGGAESSAVPNNKMTASGEARRHILPGHDRRGPRQGLCSRQGLLGMELVISCRD